MTRSADASLQGAVLGGAVAATAIVAINQAADRLGLTELDLPHVLGLTLCEPDRPEVKPAGFAWYFLSGTLLVPPLYWLGFNRLGRVGTRVGLSLGLIHYGISGLVLAASDPRRPKRARGKGRPMGPFVNRYGPLEAAANLAGHLAYGALIGAQAARQSRPSRRSTRRWGYDSLS